jgi:tRNA U34 2-thiouridine synthase MnmA/TrmU
MKAIGLLSGGLDSTLAVKLMVDQGIEVIAVKFTSPFCQCDSGGCCHAAEQASRMGIPLKTFAKGDDYLEVVRHPKHGWGSGMNPCIDCRIFMLKKTVAYMEEIGASFLFTGEVLGQRPMSQHRRALDLIERESGLVNRILRPLSAQLLPPTEAEINGWVDREKLLAVNGRSRKPQIALAQELGVTDYPCPAGGCLLTDKSFAARLRDLFAHSGDVVMRDVRLLKYGRHFRIGAAKVICGRDSADNKVLRQLRQPDEELYDLVDVRGPTVLLLGEPTPEAVKLAVDVATAHAGVEAGDVAVRRVTRSSSETVVAQRADRDALKPFRV